MYHYFHITFLIVESPAKFIEGCCTLFRRVLNCWLKIEKAECNGAVPHTTLQPCSVHACACMDVAQIRIARISTENLGTYPTVSTGPATSPQPRIPFCIDVLNCMKCGTRIFKMSILKHVAEHGVVVDAILPFAMCVCPQKRCHTLSLPDAKYSCVSAHPSQYWCFNPPDPRIAESTGYCGKADDLIFDYAEAPQCGVFGKTFAPISGIDLSIEITWFGTQHVSGCFFTNSAHTHTFKKSESYWTTGVCVIWMLFIVHLAVMCVLMISQQVGHGHWQACKYWIRPRKSCRQNQTVPISKSMPKTALWEMKRQKQHQEDVIKKQTASNLDSTVPNHRNLLHHRRNDGDEKFGKQSLVQMNRPCCNDITKYAMLWYKPVELMYEYSYKVAVFIHVNYDFDSAWVRKIPYDMADRFSKQHFQ